MQWKAYFLDVLTMVYRLKKKQLFLLLTVISLPSIYLLVELNIWKQAVKLFHARHAYGAYQDGFIINTVGCKIPNLNPFDDDIQEFIFNENPVICDAKHPLPLVESNLNSLYINRAAFPSYKITDRENFACYYTAFFRDETTPNVTFRYSKESNWFSSQINVEEEFVKVNCHIDYTEIYKDFHAFVPIKKDVEDRCNIRQTKDAVSVLIIGIDAISRLNLYRQMPETVSFIKQNLNVVEMLGYNKIDDNTFPNLIPVLTGLSVEQLEKSCWPTQKSFFDNCSFIWNKYSSRGYRTMFAEDASWMGLFSLLKRGFLKQPTDYYTKTFDNVSENEIGHQRRSLNNLCIGVRLSFKVLLEYLTKFAVTMLDRLSFSFVWSASFSHDFLNLPKYNDKDYVQLFEKLLNTGVFNKTVLIFMSDHGIRTGKILTTYQGHLEDRLPFLFIAYPDWFKKKYTTGVRNLRKNMHRLTTPFDLHKTLKDLLNLKKIDRTEIKRRTSVLNTLKSLPRGISLFLPISGNRTCEKAGIVEHWCTCHKKVNVPTNDKNVKQSVDFLMTSINDLFITSPQCSVLKLDKIISARLEKSTVHKALNTTDVGTQDYTIIIETVPGNALFEATITHNAYWKTYSLGGPISRINVYENQSYCVSHFRMKLYCYCRNQK